MTSFFFHCHRDEETRLEELEQSIRVADNEASELLRRRSQVQLELGRLERKTAARQVSLMILSSKTQ